MRRESTPSCAIHLSYDQACGKTPTRPVRLVVNRDVEVPMCAEHEAMWTDPKGTEQVTEQKGTESDGPTA